MNILEEINAIKIYVFLTFSFLVLYGKKEGKTDFLLIAIISAALLNEILAIVLQIYGLPVALSTNVFIVFHNIVWLLILREVSSISKLINWAIVIYSVVAVMSISIVGLFNFNFHLFVAGALVYVFAFMTISIKELRRENLGYFIADQYILIAAPVLFFIGFSLTFAFKSREMDDETIAGIKLYNWISYFVNIVYYSFINIYILRHKSRKNAL